MDERQLLELAASVRAALVGPQAQTDLTTIVRHARTVTAENTELRAMLKSYHVNHGPRIPTAMASNNAVLFVTCNDGSLWRRDAPGWEQLHPIPGTRRADMDRLNAPRAEG